MPLKRPCRCFDNYTSAFVSTKKHHRAAASSEDLVWSGLAFSHGSSAVGLVGVLSAGGARCFRSPTLALTADRRPADAATRTNVCVPTGIRTLSGQRMQTKRQTADRKMGTLARKRRQMFSRKPKVCRAVFVSWCFFGQALYDINTHFFRDRLQTLEFFAPSLLQDFHGFFFFLAS